MERTRELTTFAIDGYQISATFADSRNTTALGHVKQILLSSFANNAAKHTHGTRKLDPNKLSAVSQMLSKVCVVRKECELFI